MDGKQRWIVAIIVTAILFSLKSVHCQVPHMDLNTTGHVTIDIVSSCNGFVLRDANGKARLIDVEKATETIFPLPKIPLQSICWFSKAILLKQKIWAVMINSVKGADYRCQIYDIKGNKYLDVDGQGGPPNNKFLQVRSYNRIRVYKTEDLKIIPTDINPKIKYKSLKSVAVRSEVYDSRGIVIPKELLSSGFYVDLKNKNKIIFVK